MDSKEMAVGIVGLVIAVVVLAAFLPTFSQVQDDVENIHYNGDNEYCVRMSYGTPTDNLKFVKPANEMYVECYLGDAAEPYYVAPLNSVGQMGWVFCSSSYSLGITGYGPQPMDSTSKYNNQGAGGYNTVADTKTVTVNVTTGKIVTWTTDPNNTWAYYDNCDVEHMFWADPNGDYINIQVSHTALIESEKAIAGSSMTQGNYVFYTDTDNVTTTNSKSATISTVTTDLNNGLYKLTSVPMTITGLDNSVNNVTSGHVIVEYKVQGDPYPNGSIINTLIGILPVLIIVGIVLGAVSLVTMRRV